MSKVPSLTLPQIEKFNPCNDDFTRVQDLLAKHKGKRITASMARKAGCTFDDIIWVASAVAHDDPDIERRLRLFMADCAARVLHYFEKEHPNDSRPRNAIIAAREYARGEIDKAAAWDAAWAAWDARAAARDAAWDAWGAWAAWAAARAAAWAAWGAWAAWDAARAAAWAARDAARDAAWDAWGAAWEAEQEWQFDRLIARLSVKEPEDWPLRTRSLPTKE